MPLCLTNQRLEQLIQESTSEEIRAGLEELQRTRKKLASLYHPPKPDTSTKRGRRRIRRSTKDVGNT